MGVAVAVLALAACSEASKTYEQTWPKPYDKTSCAEWQSVMTQDQRLAAAGDMLWEHLSKNGATGRPGNQALTDFETVIGQGCDNSPAKSLSAVGRGIGLPD